MRSQSINNILSSHIVGLNYQMSSVIIKNTFSQILHTISEWFWSLVNFVQFVKWILSVTGLAFGATYSSSELITRTDTIILVQCPFLKELISPFILHTSLSKEVSQEATPVRNPHNEWNNNFQISRNDHLGFGLVSAVPRWAGLDSLDSTSLDLGGYCWF